MKKIVFFLFFAVAMLYSSFGTGTIRYVKSGGTGNGTSWAAAGDLQTMINASASGDQVWVAAGVYKPTVAGSGGDSKSQTATSRNNTFTMKSGVSVYGGFFGNESNLTERKRSDLNRNGIIEGWEFLNETILSGDLGDVPGVTKDPSDLRGTKPNQLWPGIKGGVDVYDDNVFTVVTFGGDNTTHCVLDGVTIAYGKANDDSGQTSKSGGGVYMTNKAGVLQNCVVKYNVAYYGGGVYLTGGTIANCYITNNVGDNAGGVYVSDKGVVVNSLISNNSSISLQKAGGVWLSGNSVADNLTVTNNAMGGIYVNSSDTKLYNSVAWANSGFNIKKSGSGTIQYCAAPDLTNDATNHNLKISSDNTDPIFASPISVVGYYYPNDGYTPKWNVANTSKLIDKGHSMSDVTIEGVFKFTMPTYDVAGREPSKRILNGTPDIGAYETFNTATPIRRYVKAGSNGTGASWADASGDIQAMIDALPDGGELWVAVGTYKPTKLQVTTDSRSATFLMKNGVRMYGGFAGTETDLSQRVTADRNGNGILEAWEFENETILSGDINGDDKIGTGSGNDVWPGIKGAVDVYDDNAYTVVTIPSGLTNTALVDGFTITGGKANDPNQYTSTTIPSPSHYGGGIIMQSSAGAVQNCVIKYNVAYRGGGVFAENGVISKCHITNNVGDVAGGAYIMSAALISNSLITNNTCTVNNQVGGLYLNNNSTAIFVTVCNNAHGGVALNNGSNIYNSIAWGNTDFQIGVVASTPPSVVSYCATNGSLISGPGNQTLSDTNNSNVDVNINEVRFENPSNTTGYFFGNDTYRWNLDKSESSFCISKGVSLIPGITYPSFDVTRTTPRILVYPDMGAYEQSGINVFVKNGDWEIANNWSSNKVPTSIEDAIIRANATISGGTGLLKEIECKDLIIELTGSITIEPNAFLNVSGDITNYGDESHIVLKSSETSPNSGLTGQLRYNGTKLVRATVEQYIKASTKIVDGKEENEWQLVTQPIREVIDGYELYHGAYLDRWKESEDKWTRFDGAEWTDTHDVIVLPFRGYSINYHQGKKLTYKGTLVTDATWNSDNPYSLTYTDNQGKGYHLLGNPYTVALDLNKFGSWTMTNIEKCIWIWDCAAGQYRVYPESFVAGAAVAFDKVTIPPMQGFWVKATAAGASLKIPYATATIGSSQPLLKNESIGVVDDMVKVTVKGDKFSDEIFIASNPDCSDGYDNGWDGTKMWGAQYAPQLFCKTNGSLLSIDVKDDIKETTLGFIKDNSGSNYSIEASAVKGAFEEIKLLDLTTGEYTDLKKSNYYFKATADDQDRFKLFLTKSEIGVEEINSNVKIYGNSGAIAVFKDCEDEGTVEVFDASGKLVCKSVLDSNLTRIPVGRNGVYLVRAVVGNKIVTDKVIVRL